MQRPVRQSSVGQTRAARLSARGGERSNLSTPTLSALAVETRTVMPEKKPSAPAGFVFVVLAAALHCTGCFLCEDTQIAPSSICTNWKLLSRVSLTVFMAAAAALRLNAKAVENLLMPIVPPPLPARVCVYASGVAELLGGLLLLVRPVHGAWLIIAILVAVFPANIYHALSSRAQKLTRIGAPAVYVRIPIQFLFFGWARWHTRP